MGRRSEEKEVRPKSIALTGFLQVREQARQRATAS
jgi:hypothetical protein